MTRPHTPLALVVTLLACLLAACGGGTPAPRIRKNAKDLTVTEKKDLVEAILKLKATPSPYTPGVSYYDQFVLFHKEAFNYSMSSEHHVAHAHPTVLPWHRKMLLLFEDALREVSGKDITLPYWDWTDPESTRAIFSESFMGTQGDASQEYAVTNGPFRKGQWTINVFSDRPEGRAQTPHPHLVRATGRYEADVNDNIHLPTAEEVEFGLRIPTFDVAPWNDKSPRERSFRNYLEGFDPERPGYFHMHNMVHTWVAGHFRLEDGSERWGTMGAPDVSPNDPVFYLHHANVDRVWAQWEQLHPGVYEDGDGHNAHHSDMYPFGGYSNERMAAHGLSALSMLDTRALGYLYE